MNRSDWLAELEEVQAVLRALVAGLDDEEQRTQYHPDISPLGWHLGHSTFIELYWLQERSLGRPERSRPLYELYFPELAPKAGRAARLPGREELLDWAARCQGETRAMLADPPQTDPAGLLRDDYLLKFLVQHHSQHAETMQLGLSQRALARPDAGTALSAEPATDAWAALPAGDYRIGHRADWSYDNESPPLTVGLKAARIARQPVTHRQYLGFVEDGGYQRAELWSEAGWRWRERQRVEAPQGWWRSDGHWRLHAAQGEPQDAVCGISLYEAEAYARWAGARLPHEYEWEAARQLDLLEGVGQVWEWCGNSFHPYPGFRSYPYDGYSLPWFDDRHQSLRGASRHTRRSIRRPSFRNFYERDKRHICAGLRLAR